MICVERIDKMREMARRMTNPPGSQRMVAIAKVGKTLTHRFNSIKTRPSLYRYYDDGKTSFCHHAETAVLHALHPEHRTRAKIYVIRFSPTGKLMMAKPCLHCQMKMSEMGVDFRRVFYTDSSGKWRRLSDE